MYDDEPTTSEYDRNQQIEFYRRHQIPKYATKVISVDVNLFRNSHGTVICEYDVSSAFSARYISEYQRIAYAEQQKTVAALCDGIFDTRRRSELHGKDDYLQSAELRKRVQHCKATFPAGVTVRMVDEPSPPRFFVPRHTTQVSASGIEVEFKFDSADVTQTTDIPILYEKALPDPVYAVQAAFGHEGSLYENVKCSKYYLLTTHQVFSYTPSFAVSGDGLHRCSKEDAAQLFRQIVETM